MTKIDLEVRTEMQQVKEKIKAGSADLSEMIEDYARLESKLKFCLQMLKAKKQRAETLPTWVINISD